MLSLGIWMVPETPAPASTLIPVNCTIIVRLSKILCERLFERLTQTVTQTGIGAGSRQRKQRSGQQIILSQKGRKGRDNPSFPPPTYLHTHEATGSSPVVSTKNHRNRLIPVIFFRNSQLFLALNFCRFFKTHNLTHTGKGAESTGQGQTGIFLSDPVFFSASAG